MASSSPEAADAQSTLRRASGRLRKQPDAYTSSPFGSAKRKRDEDGDAQMPDDYVSDEDIPSDEDEPADEEIQEQRKKARRPKSSAPKKPAQKKPKTNGTTLAIRTAVGGAKKKRAPKKTKMADKLDAQNAEGLYAQVFVSDDTLEQAAAEWLGAFEENEHLALADVVNFVLQSAGCNSTVSDQDVADPDHATERLTDIQTEYLATEPTDFPLHRKGKAGVNFKDTVAGFLVVLIRSIAAKGVLYENQGVIENLEIWFSSMSSAASRAFRHTATVASLSVMTALCEVAAERASEATAAQRQADSEKKKAKPNQGRVKQLDQKVSNLNQVQEYVELQIRDWFDTVFIHRYRDIDPVIRKECATALGDWIMALPHMFFDGQHLRYLGWVLSDSAATTRAEIIKQLLRLYKEENKLSGLKTFTERFRQRMVEIATLDADTTVRVAGIELLDVLRENGLLEPDDIDAIGRLIYDSDVRVRKAVAKFFAEIVNDLYTSKIDELGGSENLEDVLPEVGDENYEAPRLEWLKFKSLAEMLVNYDAEDDLPSQVERNRSDGSLMLSAAHQESRFTLAADAMFDKIQEMHEWEGLSGYLLFDHSSGRANGVANDTLSMLKHECVLTEKEVFVLLEVVSSSVKRSLHDLHEKSVSTRTKVSKKQKEQLSEDEEEAARHLASVIPKLLKKFGDVPNTAAAVLRMEAVLDMPSLRNLHGDAATYKTILEDVRKQFMSHGTDDVLAPASKAIQHALTYADLGEVTEEKIGSLWEDVITNLQDLVDVDTATVRGVTPEEELHGLSNNLLRITRLSEVSNCVPSLEDDRINNGDYQGAIDFIIALVQRAVIAASGAGLDIDEAELEDQVAAHAAGAATRYLQWKLSAIIKTATTGSDTVIALDELETLAARRDQHQNALYDILKTRKPSDPICATAATNLLELYISSAVLKTIKLRPGMSDDWTVLIMSLSDGYLKTILKVFTATEKTFARLSGRKLEDAKAAAEVDIDAEPLDEDPLSDSDEDEEDEADADLSQTHAAAQRKEAKQRAIVLAEQTLCLLTRSLIYAVHAGVVDVEATTKRLLRNKTKLGPNYKEICTYLDIESAVKGKKGKAKAKAGKQVVNGGGKGRVNPKSNALVAEDDEGEDEIEDDDEGEEGLRRRGLVVEREEDEEGQEGGGADAEVESLVGD